VAVTLVSAAILPNAERGLLGPAARVICLWSTYFRDHARERHLEGSGSLVGAAFNARWNGQNSGFVGVQGNVLLPLVIGNDSTSLSTIAPRKYGVGKISHSSRRSEAGGGGLPGQS
jgi:hypothetical protein